MFETLPVVGGLCLAVGYAGFAPYAIPGSGVSDEALKVSRLAVALVGEFEHSHVLFGRKRETISSLKRLEIECREAGWDGGDAIPLHPMAIHYCEQFIRALPNQVPMPELAPDPDGAVSMDWIQSRHRLFSLSVSSSNRLAYAWLDGSDRGHGVARFDGTTVPPRVLEGIQSLMDIRNAPFRTP